MSRSQQVGSQKRNMSAAAFACWASLSPQPRLQRPFQAAQSGTISAPQPRSAPPQPRSAPPQCCQRQRRRRTTTAAAAASQSESPLRTLAELFGDTGGDPGHWNYSPEWWGNQGGGWGRDPGTEVFSASSQHGNGSVTVTAHPASSSGAGPGGGTAGSTGGSKGSRTAGSTGVEAGAADGSWEEWRVLRFNDVTRQTVARVRCTPVRAGAAGQGESSSSSSGGGGGGSSDSAEQPQELQQQQQQQQQRQGVAVAAQADCLAQEYNKTAAAVTAALLGLLRLLPSAGDHSSGGGQRRLRTLCIGVGGGSLPLFLAHHFPGMDVDGVELDPVVVAAATQAMGLPCQQAQPNLQLHTADAALFLQQRQRQRQPVGDPIGGSGSNTYGSGNDGEQEGGQGKAAEGHASAPLYDLICMDAYDGEDGVPAALCTPEFAALVGAALHPQHGCFLLNLHSMEGPGAATASTFKAALLQAGSCDDTGGTGSGSDGNGSNGSASAGACFAVRTQKQRNVCVTIARGLQLPAGAKAAAERLRGAAVEVAGAAGYRFPAGSRACTDYKPL